MPYKTGRSISNNPINEQLRTALRLKNKAVGATDHDLVIYTVKGTAWLIEVKSWQELEVVAGGNVRSMSSMQLRHYVRTAKYLPDCTPLLVVADYDEVRKKGNKASVHIADMRELRYKFERGKAYFHERQLKRITMGELADMLRTKLQTDRWMKLA